jgi:hypothetical protein
VYQKTDDNASSWLGFLIVATITVCDGAGFKNKLMGVMVYF